MFLGASTEEGDQKEHQNYDAVSALRRVRCWASWTPRWLEARGLTSGC